MLRRKVSHDSLKSARVLIPVCAWCILALLITPLVQAQENTGSLRGTVRDQSAAVIPGAIVTVAGPALVRQLESVSDDKGVYLFPTVPVGTYSVTASLTGFKTVKKEGLAVKLGSEITLDFTLGVGSVSETITVTSAMYALDLTTSKTATNITGAIIDTTPKGRSFNTILQYAPGVRFEPKAASVGGGVTGTSGNNPGGGVGGYLVDGSSGNENAYVIDGVEVSNIRNAALGRESAIPFEFIREIQVKSGGFEAEYGGATGGVVNVITKSGTNDFHGEGAMMFTNAGLNSRPRGLWQRNPTDATKADFFRQSEDEYRTFYPGFQLGGPILKERLNFFASYFPEVTRTQRTTTFVSDGSTRVSTNRLIRHYALSRLDYAPSKKIQINTSYLWNPIRNKGRLYGTDGRIAPPTTDQTVLGGFTAANAYSASFAYTPTSRLFLSARYGYKFLNDRGDTYGLPTVPYLMWLRPSSQQTDPAVPAQWQGSTGKTNVSSTFQVLKDVTTRHNVYLDGTFVTRLFGQQHSFKGGYALNRMANDVNDDYINGRFDIYWGEGFARGSLDNVRGPYGYYIWEDGVRHNASVNSRNHGFYIQDAWQIHRRVTLNLGARFENEFLPPYTKEVAGKRIPNPIAFGWGDKIAPRLGGAWDVLGNGKWKLSASYGHFYDTMKYELARTSFGGDYWHERVYKLDSPDLGKLSKATPDALGSLIIDIDNRTIPINAQGQLDGIDPNIKPMESREFTVTTAHQLKSNLVFSVRYTRKLLVRGIEDIGSLDADENEVYIIGNPGFGATDAFSPSKSETDKPFKQKAPSGDPYTPKAKRNYDGVEFRFEGRTEGGRFRNLSYFAAYTWSRLYGNWSGLANADESGRSQPNVSRAFDLFYSNFDSKGRNVYGPLGTDRPHVFKLFGNYDWTWRPGTTNFSLSQIAYSGTPLSSEVTFIVPVFYNGRGDLGRTPVLTQTDLLVGHTVAISERVKVRFDANIINLFNQAIVTNVTTRLNRNGSILLPSDADFFAGFDATKLVNPNGINPATGSAYRSPNYNPIFGLPASYQGIREIRLGFHILF